MKYLAIYIIKLYKKIPGRWHSYCKYVPTCSDYAIGCFNEYGFIKGLYLTVKRIIRCNPKSKGGYDPVPLKEGKK